MRSSAQIEIHYQSHIFWLREFLRYILFFSLKSFSLADKWLAVGWDINHDFQGFLNVQQEVQPEVRSINQNLFFLLAGLQD